jgi:hypothetical protein
MGTRVPTRRFQNLVGISPTAQRSLSARPARTTTPARHLERRSRPPARGEIWPRGFRAIPRAFQPFEREPPLHVRSAKDPAPFLLLPQGASQEPLKILQGESDDLGGSDHYRAGSPLLLSLGKGHRFLHPVISFLFSYSMNPQLLSMPQRGLPRGAHYMYNSFLTR